MCDSKLKRVISYIDRTKLDSQLNLDELKIQKLERLITNHDNYDEFFKLKCDILKQIEEIKKELSDIDILKFEEFIEKIQRNKEKNNDK